MARRVGARKATVGFLHAEPESLNWHANIRIIRSLYEMEGEGLRSFKECVVFFEDNKKASSLGAAPKSRDFADPPLIARRYEIGAVHELLEHKQRSEEESFKRKLPGSQSTRAPIYLTPDTYVMVVGSIPFLQAHIGLFFSELGAATLRKLFLKVSMLRELKSTKNLNTDTFFRYDTEDELFDACNFDALAEKLRLVRSVIPKEETDMLTPEEVQQRLFGKNRVRNSG